MRIHKALKIPELEHPVPFALAPSHECEKLCVFTTGGNSQLRIGSWFMISMAFFAIIVATIAMINDGLSATSNHHRYGVVPVWILFPIGIALLVTGILSLKNAMRRSQIVIDKETKYAQIQSPNTIASNTKNAKITITESCLHTGPLTGIAFKPQWIRQATWHVVAIDVSFDCFILAAFRSINYANQYAERVAAQTKLPLSNELNEELKSTAGDRKYLFQSKDTHAHSHQIKPKPMIPIGFV